jgi:type IV secretory pathway TraG/TraD family ATPase VirD4
MKALLKTLLGNAVRSASCIRFGNVELPRDCETVHLLLAGATGTGKTTLITELLSTVLQREDRVIVCDPNGYHLSRFAAKDDGVLNPFDGRSPGWSLFNEVRRDYDYDRLARSVVPDGNGPDRQWHFYAQTLCSETMRALMLRGEGNTERLMHWITVAKKEDFALLLAGTPAQGLFDSDAAKAMASTRFILTSHVNAHKHLRPGAFSIRTWLESGRGNLFVTWMEDMQAALSPLITTWIDIVANAILSLPASDSRRVWLILDELGALGKLSSLESVLTRGRKHGLCVVAGLQSTAQLDRVYGRDGAVVLRSCFRNLVVLSIAKSDPDTAEMLSRALGDSEVERPQHSTNTGASGITKGVTAQRTTERIVLPSEISQLPALRGFVALAGEPVTRRLTVTPRDLPVVSPHFVERSC